VRMKRHAVTFPPEGISRRRVADGRRVRAALRARGVDAFPGTEYVALLAMVRFSKPPQPD